MDITCKRCQTEYEFDDALVSERGTTVRCTNCGEQFKIYRTGPGEAAPERWLVRQRDGRELVFTNLRDLQRAITNHQVGPNDGLTRGTGPQRLLGAIPELEPFFVARTTQASSAPAPHARSPVPPAREPMPTPPGIGPRPRTRTDPGGLKPADPIAPRSGRTGRPPAQGPSAPAPPPDPAFEATLHQPLPRIDYAIPRDPEPQPDDARARSEASSQLDRTLKSAAGEQAAHERAARKTPGGHEQQRASRARPETPPGYDKTQRSAAGARPSPAAARAAQQATPVYDPTPSDARITYEPDEEWFGEPRFSATTSKRSRLLRLVVVVTVVGLVGLAGATVGRKYLASSIKVAQPVQQSAAHDARIAALLDDGEKALWDGDLETAKESFDKANALAEHDARGLVDLARLAAVRADIAWLKVRLLPANQPDALSVAKRELDDAALRSRKLAERTAELLRDDPRAIRAKIDALRLAGDTAAARQLVASVGMIGSQPETSYVLAALDLAEEAPTWPVVIDRLRTAAAGEHNLLRARAELVYALVRSGDGQTARSELEKIAAAARPHPLLFELKAFVARAWSAPQAGLSGPETDAGKRAGADAAPALAAATRQTEAEPAVPAADFRELLRQASQAASSRQYDRAEQLYNAALARNPGDTEAFSGLGDVARSRGDRATARSYYEKVLARNPQYLPAIAALADIKWESGDRVGAAAMYRELVESNPQGSIARRAKERIAQVENPGGDKPAAQPASTASPAPKAPDKPSPPSDFAPGIDTSDLPGFNR
jgi:predicted Zn finger-like uncharacterized protein